MNIAEATNFLIGLKTGESEKYKMKVYNNFIGILTDLKSRDLTDNQRQSIEQEFENIDLKGLRENNKNELKRKLFTFTKYLKDELSLISKGYYTAIGMSLGMCFGLAFGSSVFGGSTETSMGLILGMIIGLAIGKNMDNKAEKEGRVLKTKI